MSVHRPRNVDWKRAAGLLYGDWGTSKAYVIGLAFAAAAYSSLPIIISVSILTAMVGFNYILICRSFPDGGGVYSAARSQSRLLAVMGALLLVANFTVTAALSGWAAMRYFGVPQVYTAVATIFLIFLVGILNYFGPKHGGSLAVTLALPMVILVFLLIALSIPHLTLDHLQASRTGFKVHWLAFINVILALSGVEAIANLTGVMKLDPGASPDEPRVGKTARWAILPVALEVVLGTVFLGWAMLSVSPSLAESLHERTDDMIRFLGEHYGGLLLGHAAGRGFGVIIGLVVGLLLLSAVNTAISALIGLLYMMARDGEFPRSFIRLNSHGVPWLPMILAVAIPIGVVIASPNLESLADLYAIGVVGAITVNLGACFFNRNLPLKWYERALMGLTFVILFGVELTIAYVKHHALFFAMCVVGGGLSLRAYAQRRAGLQTLTVRKEVAEVLSPDAFKDFKINLNPGQSILVAARGVTPVLSFAIEEARLRQGMLYVLYVKELAVSLPGRIETSQRPRWQDDPQASRIMYRMVELGRQNGVSVIPLYLVSENPAASILDLAATLGVDILMLGAPHRRTLAAILKGNVVMSVARNLPDNIQLVIHG
ncbi:MAG TPA: amino acid permease [Verrucomicrobiota bacterium]|nr:amino acid permease [Verrucomicrobiota bacterium]